MLTVINYAGSFSGVIQDHRCCAPEGEPADSMSLKQQKIQIKASK